jgi:translation initiation factor 1 (eIF-1/SUI1)
MLPESLKVRITTDRHGKALAVVENQGVELYPAQMRELAKALINAAFACERLKPTGKAGTVKITLEYALEQQG